MPALRILRLNKSVNLPAYAKPGDAAVDLQIAITEPLTLAPGETSPMLPTGIAVEIPQGHVGLVVPRSSMAKRGLMLANTVGVIDSGYRGEIMAIIKNNGTEPQTLAPLERLLQMLILPVAQPAIEEAAELSATERGTGGFGSSGTH